jgi:hypothetical protein
MKRVAFGEPDIQSDPMPVLPDDPEGNATLFIKPTTNTKRQLDAGKII